jgi:hypothetical protein
MYCASCASTINENARFCSDCGERVRSRQPAPAQQQVAPPQQQFAPSAPQFAQPVQQFAPPAPAALPLTRISRDEALAAIGARAELGDRLEPQVIDAFVDRIEHVIDERVDAQVNSRLGGLRRRAHHVTTGTTLPVAICSLIFWLV